MVTCLLYPKASVYPSRLKSIFMELLAIMSALRRAFVLSTKARFLIRILTLVHKLKITTVWCPASLYNETMNM